MRTGPPSCRRAVSIAWATSPPDDGDEPSLRLDPHGVAEAGRNGPADRSPLHLDLEPRARRQLQVHAVEPRVAGLDQERGLVVEGLLDLTEQLDPRQRRVPVSARVAVGAS